MNENNNIDARIAKSVAHSDHTHSQNPAKTAHSRKMSRLRASWATMTQTSRRSTLGGAAAVVVALVAFPLALPLGQQPLFSLSASVSQMSAEGSKLSSDASMMMPWINYNYVPSENLSREAGRGTVYKFELSGDASNRANELAEVFGVDGNATKSMYFDAAYPTYVVGSEDWTEKSVYVSWYGTGSWSYSDPAADPLQPCVNPLGADPQTSECLEYAPPVMGLNPSKADAAAMAAELFGKTGLSVTAAEIDVYRDDYVTVATAALVVGGDKVAVEWSASWSGSGILSSVVGHSATVARVGDYDTVSAYDAVARFNDWRWSGIIPWEGQYGPALYDQTARSSAGDGSAPVSNDAGGDATTGSDPDGSTSEPAPAPSITEQPTDGATEEPVGEPTAKPSGEATIEPIPEPLETPETVTVTVTQMESRLVMVWDADGNAWLVPGFTSEGENSWVNAVISLVEGILRLPEPMPIEPAVQY